MKLLAKVKPLHQDVSTLFFYSLDMSILIHQKLDEREKIIEQGENPVKEVSIAVLEDRMTEFVKIYMDASDIACAD